MSELQEVTPQVKKNILLIRTLLALLLFSFAFFSYQSNPANLVPILVYGGVLLASFIPFIFLSEEKCETVRFQNIVFSMDFLLLIGGLFVFNHFDTNFLITIFLTFFISALSQSVGKSLLVSVFVIGIYVYMIYYKSDVFNYLDPILLLSCALLMVVAIHAGYLAYRTVQEEKEIIALARKATLLTEKVREGDQLALQYAATLKNVLDSLPLGAIAVSNNSTIIFVNAKVGKILDIHPKSVTNLYLLTNDSPLGDLALTMGNSIKNRLELKKEYIVIDWKGDKKRLRLDSAPGMGPGGSAWGTLFLLQEAPMNNEG
jgi:PAS domain-containing protein